MSDNALENVKSWWGHQMQGYVRFSNPEAKVSPKMQQLPSKIFKPLLVSFFFLRKRLSVKSLNCETQQADNCSPYSHETMRTVMCTVVWLTRSSRQMWWDSTMAASSDVSLLSDKASSHDWPSVTLSQRTGLMMVRWSFNVTEHYLILILSVERSIIL